MDSKLQEKLKKLLAMSQDASSEHEALIAAKRLQVLLHRHNMSETDLEEKVVDEKEISLTNSPYIRIIVKGICELYNCNMWYQATHTSKARYFIVGREHHRMVAGSISKNVVSLINKQSREKCREVYGKWNSSFVTSFKNSAAKVIYSRCQELIQSAKRGELVDEETGETLPVLASFYDREKSLVDDFLKDKNLIMRRTKTKSTNFEGHQQGVIAGKNAPISQQIKSTSQKVIG